MVEPSRDEKEGYNHREKSSNQVYHEGNGAEKNPLTMLNCKVEPHERTISCHSPSIVENIRDGPYWRKSNLNENGLQQLRIPASQDFRVESTMLPIGLEASLSGMLFEECRPCVVGGDQRDRQNDKTQIESEFTTSSCNHASFGVPQPDHFHNFWKAGDCSFFSNQQMSSVEGEMEHVRVHPKFLHSNATSHKWAFGAVAELLDNAVDEVQNGATFVKLDKISSKRDNSDALLFLDNGGGMNPECMRRSMSLGYSSKKTNSTIGQYGNGFKTSTMRLGADAIVFSRANYEGTQTESIGLLSYTFLRRTGQNDVIVPLVDFEISHGHARPMIHNSLHDWRSNMEILLEWSPFSSEEELMHQLDDIGLQGTKIIIFNLWLNDDGLPELDFDTDKEVQNGATFVKLDKISSKRDNSDALLFLDNGGGMNPECMRRSMSLGYSSKKTNSTIGQYGNGFKTSTMRLGADAIVFSRANYEGTQTESIGLLSYTFLRRTGQNDVIVPLVDFEISHGHARPMIHNSLHDWRSNMEILLEWSPFSSEEELMHQLDDIGLQGTKIIIFNLWLNDDGLPELDFDTDKEDIRLRDVVVPGRPSNSQTMEEPHFSYSFRHSLRAYVCILYLRRFKSFQIILRGTTVEQQSIADQLKFSEVIGYKPQLAFLPKEVSVEITVGFVEKKYSSDIHGFNIYHKNRLIMPFWKVVQNTCSSGRGIVGILEANFIEPAHDKQEFERTAVFTRLEARLKQIAAKYWHRNCHLVGYKNSMEDVDANTRNHHKKISPVTSVVGLSVSSEARKSWSNSHSHDVHKKGMSNLCGKEVEGLAIPVPSSLMDPSIGNQQDAQRGAMVGDVQISVDVEENTGWTDSVSIDRISEENVQLFLRCERYRERQTELKQKIQRLEKELLVARRKCAILVSDIESQ